MKRTHFFIKNYKTIFLIGCIAIVAECCKSTQSASSAKSTTTTAKIDPLVPVESDLAIAKLHWPGTTLDELNQGYSIYADKCTDCHDTKEPQDFTVYEWNAIMPKMGRKAHLDSIQYKAVLHYILTKREAILGPAK
jgi:hypothetical protein